VDDAELARRSILGFCETVAALGGDHAVRRENAIGARVPDSDNPWLDAAGVPHGATPPAVDDDGLPHCLWAEADAVPGRRERGQIAMPCMGIALDGPIADDGPPPDFFTPTLDEVGLINDRAYGQVDALAPLIGALQDDRIATHGIRVGGEPVAVALTVRIGDDVSIQYVATARRHRRRGHASRLMIDMMNNARATGATTATLQASPDGRPVYERLGFRTVALLRAFIRE
jgi:ribosomal protein S18 acetylase RimI-like enzyme